MGARGVQKPSRFGSNFRLAPFPQFSSTLPSCLQLFAPTQAAQTMLGLAHLEAQMILNQLGNLNSYLNPLLPSFLQAFLLQNAANLSLYQPSRHILCPVLRSSHAPNNPTSEKVFSSELTDGRETTKSKQQSGIQVMGVHSLNMVTQQHKHDSNLSIDKEQPAVMSSTVHSSVNQHKIVRMVPATAPSRYTSRDVFDYSHSRRKDWRTLSRGSAHVKRTHQTQAHQNKHYKEWCGHHSPSRSVSPSPSWSPSPPPLSHKIHSQSPHSSERYSPSDLVYECSSSEHGPTKKTSEYSECSGYVRLKNKNVDLNKQKTGPTSYEYLQSIKKQKQNVSFLDPNGRRDCKKRKDISSIAVACYPHCRYPSSKKLKKDNYRASAFFSSSSSDCNSKTHTSEDASFQNVQQMENNIKKEKDPWETAKSPSPKSSQNATHQLYLSGIPTDAKYQDVCHSLAPFGAVKELVFVPGLDKLSPVSAFLCMLKEEDAEMLSKCQSLTIGRKSITVTPYQNLVAHIDDLPGNVQMKQPVFPMDSGEAHLITTPDVEEKKGVICISGVPFDDSEIDLIKLVTPFGEPIKILIATEIDLVNGLDWRKALVVLSSELSAMEIVKVYSVVPVHLRQYDVTLVHQTVDFSSPVSIFQALVSPRDPDGSLIPQEHLLVISNIPDQPHISTDVLQQVQSFSKARRILVLPEEKATDHQNMFGDENTHCIKMIFEMDSSVNVLLAFQWIKKNLYILSDHCLQFSMGNKPLRDKSGGIDNNKSWKRQTLEENWRAKHHDTSPGIPESVEGVLVLISGFPENMDSEDDFMQIAAPHGVPTKIVIAAAQRKALVEIPDKDSAKKMVMAYNAIPVGLKQLDMKLLPETMDINNVEDVPDPFLLITVTNVPDTVSGISQVQKLVQAYGAVNRTLILNNNMVIFEMTTSEMAKVAYEQLKKIPYTVQRHTLCFLWGSSLSETTKEGDVLMPTESLTSTHPAHRPTTSITANVGDSNMTQHFHCCMKTKETDKC